MLIYSSQQATVRLDMNYAKKFRELDADFFSKLNSVDIGYVSDKGKASKCWEYTGTLFENGYGRVYKRPCATGETKAHRYAFILGKGKIGKKAGKSLLILHKCDNRKCCNPKHLYASDHRQNMDDMVLRARSAKGEVHGNSILVNAEVAFIKLLVHVGFSYRVISEMTLVPRSTASRFVSEKAWHHVPRMKKCKDTISEYVRSRKEQGQSLRMPDLSGVRGANASNALIPVRWVRECVSMFGQVETARMLDSSRKKIRVLLERSDSTMLSVDPKTKQFTQIELDVNAKVRNYVLQEIAAT